MKELYSLLKKELSISRSFVREGNKNIFWEFIVIKMPIAQLLWVAPRCCRLHDKEKGSSME